MKLIPLLEITFSDAPQVDRDAGVIRGVRILGRNSRNGREYSDAALQQAARFYERLGVNLNHPVRPQSDGARDVQDGFGWLESIDVRADGVYGDLHYLTVFPQTGNVATFPIDPTDSDGNGIADDLFRFAKLGSVAGN